MHDRIKKIYPAAFGWISQRFRRGTIPAAPLTIVLAAIAGVLTGYGAVAFAYLFETIHELTVLRFVHWSQHTFWGFVALAVSPVVGVLFVAWFTRFFRLEGQAVPEVIKSVARKDGVIRPLWSLAKVFSSAVCIGAGGSVGPEGPMVLIGSSIASAAGQFFRLSSRNLRTLVAAGAAAGISAAFHAPIAGVIFSCEIILGSFAVESLTPIVIAAVLADVVQQQVGEHGVNVAFRQIPHEFSGNWIELPSYFVLGIVCGFASIGFVRLLYWTEDFGKTHLTKWWIRALVYGSLVGVIGTGYFVLYPAPPTQSVEGKEMSAEHPLGPALYGVGYETVEHSLHLENADDPTPVKRQNGNDKSSKTVMLNREQMIAHLWWLIPLVLLKPVCTSLTLGGGGAGGIFAPSLFLGAVLGGAYGIICNLISPDMCASPGAYALVGMGAVVAGTTHGVLSAILIVYELTGDYHIILPIMGAACISSLVAWFSDRENIYSKRLARSGESIARSHDLHGAEHIKVRDVMIRRFPTVKNTDNLVQIIKVARQNPHIESLPVMDEDNRLIGIIRPEDLHRVMDTDVSPYLVNADDIALMMPISVSPDENLLEALRDFGSRDVDTLPVEIGEGGRRQLIGLLLRADVMSRYREAMLSRH
ncbi:chloride channel protein [Blastopirellula sp. JC732]|uniref:Chloride channel protein n=1 Tax=Blastopirellula sediminis TaxID=2894196 RepID=A0A9X1SJ51_9BACT|nr:chloride channel protein [Blastopirellula sediminis]MCC9605174.1 chloride channel protein [Blastopirellula sediminis]MCC9631526.1 chloride channel protein [Blastopirellula sediminis]